MNTLKFVLLISFSFLALSGCKNKTGDDNDTISSNLVTNPITASGSGEKNRLPVMEFEETSHDFGIVVQGEKVAYTFTFTNTGGSDLVISNTSSTCGCTVSNFSRKPIKPGEKGKIEVVFNSAGRTGANTKSISVLTNAQPNTILLEISAEVFVPNEK